MFLLRAGKLKIKVPARSYIGGAGAGAGSPRGFFRWVRADKIQTGVESFEIGGAACNQAIGAAGEGPETAKKSAPAP